MPDAAFEQLKQKSQQLLQDWLQSCTRRREPSRNTIAVGIVLLNHLRSKCPVTRDEVASSGGEIKGSRGKTLQQTLRTYGIIQPEKYLKEVTTRQAHQDGQRLLELFEYGYILKDLTKEQRDQLLQQLIKVLVAKADEWFHRQNLKISLERQHSPAKWIRRILEEAKGRSNGIVEQHLIGAKLEKRYMNIEVPNFPSHAADAQTNRPGDFSIGDTVYHVTAMPGHSVIQKCSQNIKAGLHPVLLVPNSCIGKATIYAEDEGIEEYLSIISIEDFVGINIIEMAMGTRSLFFDILQNIISVYNRRLEKVETDMSLKIEV